MTSTTVRKLPDGEELIVVGQVPASRMERDPRDASIERRSQAMAAEIRTGSTKVVVVRRPKK